MKFIADGVANSTPSDTTLIRLLVRSQKIAKRMFEPNFPPLDAVAREERSRLRTRRALCDWPFSPPILSPWILAGMVQDFRLVSRVSDGAGRVGVWRGGVRLSISVCRPFRLAVP